MRFRQTVSETDRPEPPGPQPQSRSPGRQPQSRPPGRPVGHSGTPPASAPPRGVQAIGSLVAQLMARRGYAQVMANEQLQAALQLEVGPEIAAVVRVGHLKSGLLHIYVADSVTMQELTFRKRQLVKRLQAAQPNPPIKDLRFHISAAV